MNERVLVAASPHAACSMIAASPFSTALAAAEAEVRGLVVGHLGDIFHSRMLRILLLYLCGTLSVGQPDFFDNLRLNATEVASDYPHSAVYQVNTTDGRTVRLADLQVFLPFSINGLLRPGVVNDVLAAALAIQQTPCPDFGITMEVTNTRFSPIETTRAFTELLRRPISLQQPPPAAVVGAFRSAVTSPLAVLTGINRLPQVSWASTSSDFSDKEQYPYFGRTVSDTVGEAEVAVQFFQSMGATHVAIAFIAVRTTIGGSRVPDGRSHICTNHTGLVRDGVAESLSGCCLESGDRNLLDRVSLQCRSRYCTGGSTTAQGHAVSSPLRYILRVAVG